MGITALWKLLEAEQVVEHYKGSASTGDFAAIVATADGAVVAVDLSPWLCQVGGTCSWWGVALAVPPL
jgi:hypothetical protein